MDEQYVEEPIAGLSAFLRRQKVPGVRKWSAAGQATQAQNVEFKDQSYWDFVTVATGFSEAQFFTIPLGQGTTPKKLGDTNLTTSGQITDGDAYHIHGIAFGWRDNGATPIPWTEANKILWNGMLEFSISGRRQFQAHLSVIGWGGGLYIVSDAAAAAFLVSQNGFPSRNTFYKLRNVIVLPRAVTFEVKCFWNGPITLAASRELGVRLEGRLQWPRVGA